MGLQTLGILCCILLGTFADKIRKYQEYETDRSYGTLIGPSVLFQRSPPQYYSETQSLCNCPAGPAGLPGAPGEPGYKGKKGSRGHPGQQGSAGRTGNPGRNGAKGDTGPVGPPGASGLSGLSGPIGPVGSVGIIQENSYQVSQQPIFVRVQEGSSYESSYGYDSAYPKYTYLNRFGSPPASSDYNIRNNNTNGQDFYIPCIPSSGIWC